MPRLFHRFLVYPSLFFTHAGSAVYFVLFLVLLSGITEIIGVSMILPIIELTQNSGETSPLTTHILDIISTLGFSTDLKTLLGLVLGIFFLKAGIMFWQAYMLERTSVMLSRALQERLMTGLATVSYSYFTKLETGSLINLLFRETTRFSSGFVRYVGLCGTIIYTVIYFTTATFLSFEITISVILLGCIALIFMRFAANSTRRVSQLVTKSYADAQSFVVQVLTGYLYFKATNSIKSAHQRSISGFNWMAKLNRSMAIINAAVANITEPLAVLMLVCIIFFQVSIYDRPVGEVFVLAIIYYRAFGRLMTAQLDWQKFNRSLGGVEAVQTSFQNLTKYHETSGFLSPPPVNQDIELRNISYQYSDKIVLQDINLIFEGGKSIGIVGESGSGKSTLFLLIAGIIKPCSGSIRLGDVDYSKIDINLLRQKIGFVTQDPILITDSIANNICLWSGDSGDAEIHEKIVKAAELANCMDFISEMPEGLNTILGERGITLSGGQKQRIAIAREIYKDPKLMIFDEATSALDAQSEKIVQESIEAMHSDRTVIIVAHRLSTIRHCDEIIVLSNGSVKERGSFESLASDKNSQFYKLLKNQTIFPE